MGENNRYQLSSLPRGRVYCPREECVYNRDLGCDDIRTYKGNSDATCHRKSNKFMIEFFKWITPKN